MIEVLSGRVLIADSNVEFTRSVARVLTKAGYDVGIAKDAQHAKELIRVESFAVALVDQSIQGSSDLRLFKELRQISPDTSLIVLSVKGCLEKYNEALDAGAFAHLDKPVKMRKILDYVRLAAGRYLSIQAYNTSCY